MGAGADQRRRSPERYERFAGGLAVRTVAGLMIAALLSAALALGHTTWPVGVLALLGSVAICTVELSYAPAAALVAFVLVPVVYLSANTRHGALNPEVPIMLVLLIRFGVERRRLHWGRHLLPLVMLTLWVVTMTALSTVRSTSEAWTLDFITLLVLPAVLLVNWEAARKHLLTCWLAIGGVVGFYGIIEWLLKRNIVYGHLFAEAGLVQSGGAYRITTTLGHPLVNGIFFCVTTLLGVGRIVRAHRPWEVIATAFAGVALLATGSRGAVLAFAIGLVFTLAGSVFRTAEPAHRRRAVAVIVVFLALAGGGAIYASTRTDLSGSTSTRLETYQAGEMLIHEYWPFGAGAGVADELKVNMPVGEAQRTIESSALELAAELGLPGVVLTLWLLLAAISTAFRRQPEVAGALVAFCVAASSFNFWDEYRPGLLILGLLIGSGAATVTEPLPGQGPPSSVRTATLRQRPT
jgi:hypothetical protein